MKKVVVSIVSAAALATASIAMAGAMTSKAALSQSNGAGVFVSGNVGYGILGIKRSDFTDPNSGATATKLSNSSFAWATNLGYQFNQYVAVEAGYISFGRFDATVPVGLPPETFKATFGGFDAAVKGILPISDRFNVFGKIGTVDMHLDADATFYGSPHKTHGDTWVPLLAVGTSYNVSKNLAVTLQDDYAVRTNFTHNGKKAWMPEANAILAGISYKF